MNYKNFELECGPLSPAESRLFDYIESLAEEVDELREQLSRRARPRTAEEIRTELGYKEVPKSDRTHLLLSNLEHYSDTVPGLQQPFTIDEYEAWRTNSDPDDWYEAEANRLKDQSPA